MKVSLRGFPLRTCRTGLAADTGADLAAFIGVLFIVLLAAVNAQPSRPATLVLFDEAHYNLFTTSGEFRGFAQLLTRAGYELRPNDQRFTSEQVLDGASLLIIAGALGADSRNPIGAANDAFTARENEVLHSWVSSGGALLLVVDHEPTGSAAATLARRFGFELVNGTTHDVTAGTHIPPRTDWLLFRADNALLGDHPIIHGRGVDERVHGVATVSGSSIAGPSGSSPLLRLSPTAFDKFADGANRSATGRAAAMAVVYGQGRIVVLGEAGMLKDGNRGLVAAPAERWGLNNDQFGLNVVGWLTKHKAGYNGLRGVR